MKVARTTSKTVLSVPYEEALLIEGLGEKYRVDAYLCGIY